MNPKFEETKKQFIDRGVKDQYIIDAFPDAQERIKYLSDAFDNAAGEDLNLMDFKAKLLNALLPKRGATGPAGPQGAKGLDGVNGEKGERGDPGYTPVKGKDYFTPSEIETIKSQILKEVPAPIETTIIQKAEIPIDVINSLIDEAFNSLDHTLNSSEVKSALESLKGDDRLDAKYIKNLPKGNKVVYGGGNNSGGSSGGAVWGSITGTLSDQTDLQTQLTNLQTLSIAYAIALG